MATIGYRVTGHMEQLKQAVRFDRRRLSFNTTIRVNIPCHPKHVSLMQNCHSAQGAAQAVEDGAALGALFENVEIISYHTSRESLRRSGTLELPVSRMTALLCGAYSTYLMAIFKKTETGT